MKKILFALLVLWGFQLNAQNIERIDPPHWWVGMNNPHLQLMIYGENIASFAPTVNTKDITITGVLRTENSNYLFLNLDVKHAKSGAFKIDFKKKGKRNNFSVAYVLKERVVDPTEIKGFDSSDAIYLITPDRFVNGSEANDIDTSLKQTKIDRSHGYERHGGDIKGITSKLDYISDLGFTAIWSTPLLINDMYEGSYHGYAITDLYKVDPRFGTMDEYVELAEQARKRGIKLVMDQVANHIGLEHFWMKDLPTGDWVNFQKDFEEGKPTTYSNHRRTTNQDNYASDIDSKGMNDGWFVRTMPDLNQRNPMMANYLIQNSIWWIEQLQLGGIRQDTYPYPDKAFMSLWAKAIMDEYPNFSIVGEEWSYNPLLVGYWQQGQNNKDGYQSNLTSSMDFPLQRAIADAVNEDETWGTGFVKMYEGLANDFHYPSPKDIMIFPDNHDMDRIFTQVNHDVTKAKMAIGYMAVLPRILQLYYGTEVLIENSAKPGDHGLIRTDFPGGWKGDKVNGFTGKGLSADQKGMQSFMKKLLNYRKGSKAIHKGETKHFAPKDKTYVLFRKHGDEVVVVLLNKNKEAFNLDLNRFDEMNLKGRKLKNMISGELIEWNSALTLHKEGIYLFTTKF